MNKQKIVTAAVLGSGGALTAAWVGLLGWTALWIVGLV